MKYDCGTLAAHPRQSEIFRIVHDRPAGYSRSHGWPDHIQQEACVLFHTPGISIGWLEYNLNLGVGVGFNIRDSLAARWPEYTKLGVENAMSATYDDARRYVERGPKGSPLPIWAVPFLLEDKKNGMSHSEIRRVWGRKDIALKRNLFSVF